MELVNVYGKGYSKKNLFKMIQFYEGFKDCTIVPTLSAQLLRSHLVEIISIEDNLKREVYATFSYGNDIITSQKISKIKVTAEEIKAAMDTIIAVPHRVEI
jgi:hypothetical protein